MRSIALLAVLASSLLLAFSSTADAAKPAAQYWMTAFEAGGGWPGVQYGDTVFAAV